jgi:uncharacterized membrane protein
VLKLLIAFLGCLIGAAAVHIAVIFAIPMMAENNAWGRLAKIAELNQVARVDSLRSNGATGIDPLEKPGTHDFAFIDPAFVTAGCRFSLADGPVRLVATGRTDFWSASIYSRPGDNLYSINDRSAVDGQFDLLVGTAEQLKEAAGVDADRDETAIPVGIDATEGYLTLRVLVDEESRRPQVDAFIASVSCTTALPPEAGNTNAKEG